MQLRILLRKLRAALRAEMEPAFREPLAGAEDIFQGRPLPPGPFPMD